jgi:hypothetical protein
MPIVKDTQRIDFGDYAILRFIADNPGVWLFESNMDYLPEKSFAVVLFVGNDRDLPTKPKNWPDQYSFGQLESKPKSKFFDRLINSCYLLVIELSLI